MEWRRGGDASRRMGRVVNADTAGGVNAIEPSASHSRQLPLCGRCDSREEDIGSHGE